VEVTVAKVSELRI